MVGRQALALLVGVRILLSQFLLPSNSGRNPKEQRNKASQRGLLRALQDARRMIGKKCSNSAVEQKGLAEGPGYGFTQHKNS